MTSIPRITYDPESGYGDLSRTRKRWVKTMAFLGQHNCITALDIGGRYKITDMLENHFGVKFSNTDVDLDVDSLKGSYDIITCFEVLEHLFNPLHCLLEMKKVLAPGGRIYLSTPRSKPHYLWGHHFHEMSVKSVNALFGRAGLKVVRHEFIIVSPWRSCLSGLRPWIRMAIDRVMLFELA